MSDSPFGATPEEWLRFDLLGLNSELLPVVCNPNAKIAPNSNLKTLGKVPSQYNAYHQVIGVPKWTSKTATDTEVEAWSRNPDYGICLQARTIRAFDVDITDPEVAMEIGEIIQGELDWLGLPMRIRSNSPKFLLGFRLLGEFGKRKIECKSGIIEFLANGQQFIAAGQHQSGVRYEWQFADGSNDFPYITADDLERIWKILSDKFGIYNSSSDCSIRQSAPDLNLDDPLVDYIKQHPSFIREGDNRELFIECPFKEDHTNDSGDTETVYFPKGTNGYNDGHFKCMHAHCQGKSNSAFEIRLGFCENDFSVIECGDNNTEPPIEDKNAEKLFPISSAYQYANRPRPGWIVKGLVPRADIMAIFGESGGGKTFVALDLALAIVQGKTWLDRESVAGRVVYIVAEGAGGFRNRLEAYAIHNEISLEKDVGDRLQVIDAAPNFLSNDEALRLARTVISAGGKCDVIFVDTLAQVTIGGNENAAEDMSKAIANCKNLHAATGALVVLVHHAGKDLERGLRGWSGLKGALDANLEVMKGDGEVRTLKVEKMKDGKDGDSWNFMLNDVVLPIQDIDGEEETSKVVEFLGAALPKSKKTPRQQVKGEFPERALACWNVLRERGEVPLEELIKAIIVRTTDLVFRSEGGKTPPMWRIRSDAMRALSRLRDRGIVTIDENNNVTFSE